MMDKERDLLGQMFLVCTRPGVTVLAFGDDVLFLLSVLN